MARVALPGRWIGALTRQRGPLRIYQWLWLLICALGGLVVAAPRILSQPVRYSSTALVQIDVAKRYRELYTNGAPDPDFRAVEGLTLELLKAKHPDLGGPTFSVAFEPHADGGVAVVALSGSAEQARDLANEAAEALARNVRAAGGREIMRNLMGWELKVALDGREPETQFQRLLRAIILTSAFPLNRPVETVSEHITVDQLAPEELSDLTRALEVRSEQIVSIELPALQDRRGQATGEEAGQLDRDLKRVRQGLAALRAAQDYLYTTLGAVFAPDARSDAYRSAVAPLPAAEIDRQIVPLLALAALLGLVFGGVGVAVDRGAGVMSKLRELWEYRELIRNLVLRDLRVRYKGSAFGYLWTQAAPLLMMLLFWLVFSKFFPSGIALFPVFLIVALLPWNYCVEAVMGGARSVIDNANLIKKVFFPREVLPLVSVFSSLLNYLLSLPMMFLVMGVVQLALLGRLNFSWTFAYLPVLLVIQTLFLAGVTLFLSALAVFFRDTVHLLGILVQFWFFVTPVFYSLDVIDQRAARVIRWVNPMASLIDFYRDTLYGNTVTVGLVPTPGLPALASVLRVLLTALVVLALGYWFFQRRSGRFGEEL